MKTHTITTYTPHDMIPDYSTPEAFGLKQWPDCYLHVTECRSGEQWIKPMKGNSSLDLKTQVEKWVKEQFCGELFLDGEITPRLEGTYYGRIITDGREPDSIVTWESGGWYLK